jgi:hypothetical protein
LTLKVHETATAEGGYASVHLSAIDGALALVLEDGASRVNLLLPDGALDAVMARFGKPLDPAASVHEVASLDLGAGSVLRHVRHLARYDVIARDYVVSESPGREPLCALATTVAGALEHLARAANALDRDRA